MDYDLDALDMNVLDEARNLLKKRWPEMVEGYIEDAEMYIENIKTGLANDDEKAVSSSAHPLKSSSQSMGLLGLGEIAMKIEHDAKDAMENSSNISHLQELVPLLEKALKRAEPKLRDTMGDVS